MIVKTKRTITVFFDHSPFSSSKGILVRDCKREDKWVKSNEQFTKNFGVDFARCMCAFVVDLAQKFKEDCPSIMLKELDIWTCESSERKDAYQFANNYWAQSPEASKPKKEKFFRELLGLDDDEEVVDFRKDRRRTDSAFLDILKTTELKGDYEINGVKVSEIEGNFEWQEKLKEKEKSIEKKIEDGIVDKKNKLELEKQEYCKRLQSQFQKDFKELQSQFEEKFAEIEAKEKQLLSGFQDLKLLFDKIQKPTLAELQTADFITADEKRIICGLFPKNKTE